MTGCQRQSLRVEIIDGQVAVRLDDDWFRSWFYRLRIDSVRQSLLNDDGVGEIAFGLTQEIADVDGFAGAAHAEQHGMLRGTVAFAASESLYPHQIAVGTFVKSLCRFQMAGERGAEWQHVGQITVLCVQFPGLILAPGPTRPRLIKQSARCAWQRALIILRPVH